MRLGTALTLPLLLPAALGLTACGERGSPSAPARPPDTANVAAATPPTDAQLLAAWHERRAAAWASGDARALRRLYVDGAGRADVRLLTRYRHSGLVVEGLAPQLLTVTTLRRAGARRVLLTTWRLSGSTAVRTRDGATTSLPRSGPTTTRVTLLRRDGTWRVASIQ